LWRVDLLRLVCATIFRREVLHGREYSMQRHGCLLRP
jgi:hypothetical protein